MAYLPAKRLPLHIRLNFFMRLSEETKESSYGAHLISLMFVINRKLLWSIFFRLSKQRTVPPNSLRHSRNEPCGKPDTLLRYGAGDRKDGIGA